jgi:integrase
MTEGQKKKKSKGKRARTGQVQEVAKGKWRIRFSLGKDGGSGKRLVYTETYAAENKGQAESRLRELLRRRDSGEPFKYAADSFDSFLDEWLAAKKPSVAESAYKVYADTIRLYIRPKLGKLTLARVEADAIQKLYNKLRDEKKSLSTIRQVHQTLGMVFKLALVRRKIRLSPMLGVVLPKDNTDTADRQTKAMSAEQVARFLEAAKGNRFENLFRLAFHVGCRPGELLGLAWADINPEAGTLRVTQTIVWRASNDWYIKAPKTKLSRRTITLTPALVGMLKAHRREQFEKKLSLGPGWTETGFVFTDDGGNPCPQHSLRYECKKILKRAGLPWDFSPYTARHTMASLLIEGGTNIKAVSERLGHSEVGITLNTYTHVSEGFQAEVSGDIERILEDGKKRALQHTDNNPEQAKSEKPLKSIK